MSWLGQRWHGGSDGAKVLRDIMTVYVVPACSQ
jgi:hypothetical protein